MGQTTFGNARVGNTVKKITNEELRITFDWSMGSVI